MRGGSGVQEEPGAWEDGFDMRTGRKSRGGKTAGKEGECRRLWERVVQMRWELGAACIGQLQRPGGLPVG